MTLGPSPQADDPVVLLDLDGTLTDPASGILSAVRAALVELGRPPPEAAALRWVIGPPLRASFARLLGGTDQVETALALYRERYGAGGLFDAELYPGVRAALAAMAGRGWRLWLCTAKPAVYAERIVDHFGLAPPIAAVYGPDLDGRFDDKGDLIAHILSTTGADPARAVMVGDRGSDISAARRNGLRALAVGWGYGDAAELADANAHCAEMAALPGMVGRLLAA
jgi:phosphoglycolate phosphatase